MTDTVEHVQDISLDRLAPHPLNVRRSLGDLRELTRSIRERGIEVPLVVMPAEGDGVHHIVAGHRRRAAAEAAGRSSAPCIVRGFVDEADVVLSMLAENTQRSDGLNIVDEAQALASVIDLRGGVSSRRLATAVGHSEGWVRTRLRLLTLPDCALDALHAGKVTLDAATALTDVVDEPDLVEELVHRPNLSVWQIEAASRERAADRAVSEASTALDSAGLRPVGEAEWREQQRSWKTLDDLELDPAAHRREPCHTVVVKAKFDATVVEIPICTEPRRHRGRRPDSELVVPERASTEADRQQQADRRGRKAAADARSSWLSHRLSGRAVPAAEVVPLAIASWIDSAPYTVVEQASLSLGLSAKNGQRSDPPTLLHQHLADDPKGGAAVALALVAATCEERARHDPTSTTVARYLDTIERLGYQPTDWEHTQRLAAS
jgi:ParB/RepB/Spo0J family partition protein